jgi:hypothetical protein
MISTKVETVLEIINDDDITTPMVEVLHDSMIQEDKTWREDLMKWWDILPM